MVLADEAALRYAYRVAGTVGLVCHVLDCHAPSARAHAIDLGIVHPHRAGCARGREDEPALPARDLVGNADPATFSPQLMIPTVRWRGGKGRGRKTAVACRSVLCKRRRGYRYLPLRAHLSIAVAAVYRQIVQLAVDFMARRSVGPSRRMKLRCSVLALAGLVGRFGRPAASTAARSIRLCEGTLCGLTRKARDTYPW